MLRLAALTIVRFVEETTGEKTPDAILAKLDGKPTLAGHIRRRMEEFGIPSYTDAHYIAHHGLPIQ